MQSGVGKTHAGHLMWCLILLQYFFTYVFYVRAKWYMAIILKLTASSGGSESCFVAVAVSTKDNRNRGNIEPPRTADLADLIPIVSSLIKGTSGIMFARSMSLCCWFWALPATNAERPIARETSCKSDVLLCCL